MRRLADPPCEATSTKTAKMTKIHSQPVTPRPPVFQRITYMSVVNGRKMIPRIG